MTLDNCTPVRILVPRNFQCAAHSFRVNLSSRRNWRSCRIRCRLLHRRLESLRELQIKPVSGCIRKHLYDIISPAIAHEKPPISASFADRLMAFDSSHTSSTQPTISTSFLAEADFCIHLAGMLVVHNCHLKKGSTLENVLSFYHFLSVPYEIFYVLLPWLDVICSSEGSQS